MAPQLTIKFFLRTDFKMEGGRIPIYVRVILNREKFDFSSKMVVLSLNEWDELTQRVKSVKSPINKELSEIEHKVQEAYNFLKYHGRDLTIQGIRNQLKGEKKQLRPRLKEYLADYLVHHVDSNPDYAPSTKKTYRTTFSHVLNFLVQTQRTTIRVSEVDLEFIKELDHYLQNRSISSVKGVNKNSANKYHIVFKAALYKAFDKKLIDKNPYKEFKFKSQSGRLTYLTTGELEMLEKHNLGNNASLQRVRDIFLFSVYTGLRYSDAINLRAHNIEVQGKDFWITYTQIKTSDPNRIPMLSRAKEIYDKYEETRKITGYVLPQITNQKLNAYLKVIAEIVGIRKHLSHHVARHTAATTIFLQNGVPLETTGKFLGQRSIRSTQIYAKVTNVMLKDAANKLNKIL